MEKALGRTNTTKTKTVMIFKSRCMNMCDLQKKKSAAASQNVWVGEVEKVWGTPISQEAKKWISRHLKAKLQKNHDGRLSQSAAVEVAKRDMRVERYVDKQGLQMRASDTAWAWVAHKVQLGQVVGKVFRPELGKLAQHEEQVLWQLVAMASTGWGTEVRGRVTRETLLRVVLSRQVLKSVYRVTDKARAMQNGVSVAQTSSH